MLKNLEKTHLVCVLFLLCTFYGKKEIINRHIKGGIRESDPCVQELQHPQQRKPRRGLLILDMRMRFPRHSLNVVIDSFNLHPGTINPTASGMYVLILKLDTFVKHRCPRRPQSKNMAQFSKSHILTPPHPRGM